MGSGWGGLVIALIVEHEISRLGSMAKTKSNAFLSRQVFGLDPSPRLGGRHGIFGDVGWVASKKI